MRQQLAHIVARPAIIIDHRVAQPVRDVQPSPLRWHAASQHMAQQLAPDDAHPLRAAAGHWPATVRPSTAQHLALNRVFLLITLLTTRAWLRLVSRGNRHFTVGGGRLRQSGPRSETISLRSACTRRLMDFITNGFSSKSWAEQIPAREAAAAATNGGGGGVRRGREAAAFRALGKSHSPKSSSSVQHIELSIRAGISNPVPDSYACILEIE
ncbi:DNA binding protein [Dorcoceras hygrometricum]|uniref:DNA binding protein n=1 Tax=Dorcoceras hygrometricum TaxID=472368 RepID=A0A2Z7D7H5_9LAMI|nr:DNA binding protein [Dorcoceras hygrometricum]